MDPGINLDVCECHMYELMKKDILNFVTSYILGMPEDNFHSDNLIAKSIFDII